MQDETTTESVNEATADLDRLSTRDLVALMNREDATVATAVAMAAPAIEAAIDLVAARLADGGRLVYVGAGTSGRLGVLDASECVPTFSTEPGQVVGLIAGGDEALRVAAEGAEDDPAAGAADLDAIGLQAVDVVVGIAASGSTPYVLGALDRARDLGAAAIAVTCNAGAEVTAHADLTITAVTGPEVLAGSTRMKAGTATKMILNMLSTGAMIRLGKTYGNLMVDLHASNDKLRKRTLRLVMRLTGLDAPAARAELDACGGELKTTVVAARLQLGADEARARLRAAGGRLRDALESGS